MNQDQLPIQPVEQVSPAIDPEPVIPWGWVRVAAFLVTLVIAIIPFGLIVVLAFGIVDENAFIRIMDKPVGLAVQFIQTLAFILPVILFRRLVDRRSIRSLGLTWNAAYAKDFLAGLAWGAGLIAVIFALLYAGGGLTVTTVRFPTTSFLIMTLVMLMVGFGEEITMRGYVLNNLMTSMDKYAALIVTSLVFSASHAVSPNVSWPGLMNIILAGLLLGIYYVHKRNLWFPIGLHITWNLFQGSFFGSPVSGIKISSVIEIELTGHELLTGGQFGFEASLVTTGVLAAAIILFHLIYRPRQR